MAADEIALKLTLDKIDADKNLTGFAKALDKTKARGEAFAKSLNNSVGGRVLKGIGQTVVNELGTLFDQQLPQALKDFELKVKGTAATVEALTGSRIAGEQTEAIARAAGSNDAKALQRTFATLQGAQGVLPGVAIDEKFAKQAATTLYAYNQQALAHANQLTKYIDDVIPSRKVRVNAKAIAAAGLDVGKGLLDLGLSPGRDLERFLGLRSDDD